MRDISRLVEKYEMFTMAGVSTADVATHIYSELIQDGCTCEEMKDKDFVMDLLLIGLEYEFADEETLEYLADDISVLAEVDSLPDTPMKELLKSLLEMDTPTEFDDDKIPFSDLPEEEYEPEFYIVASVDVNPETLEKQTSIISKVFTSIDDIREYVDRIGLMTAVENALSSKDLDIGSTGMLATEDAMDALDSLGMEGMLIAEQIPEGAVGAMTLVTTNKQRDIVKSGTIFAVFEADEYEA